MAGRRVDYFMQLKNYLILIGTFWPLAGVCLAGLIASLLTGWKRWLMLFAGPVLFLLPCFLYFEELAYNGNMLFVAMMGIVFVAAYVYYPVLVIVGIISVTKDRQRGKESDSSP